MRVRVEAKLTKSRIQVQYRLLAEVAEQADALRSGRSGLYAHVGSTPTFGTLAPDEGHRELFFREVWDGPNDYRIKFLKSIMGRSFVARWFPAGTHRATAWRMVRTTIIELFS